VIRPLGKNRVRRAVIPAAGLGTRFLPATKGIPKEMLPLVDRPLIQYAVEDALAAGIEHIVIVTSRGKGAIEDYFDMQPELDFQLRLAGKTAQIDELAALQLEPGTISYVRQQLPRGLGHAVWCARHVIGDEPFAVLLPDMVPVGGSCLAGAVKLFESTGGNVVAVEECNAAETDKYGIVERGRAVEGGFAVKRMIEKPAPDKAPSNHFINGRYVLQPRIFDILRDQQPGAANEIQLTDAMNTLMSEQEFFAFPFASRMYDCGSKAGFIEATVAFALERRELAAQVAPPLETLVRRRVKAS